MYSIIYTIYVGLCIRKLYKYSIALLFKNQFLNWCRSSLDDTIFTRFHNQTLYLPPLPNFDILNTNNIRVGKKCMPSQRQKPPRKLAFRKVQQKLNKKSVKDNAGCPPGKLTWWATPRVGGCVYN